MDAFLTCPNDDSIEEGCLASRSKGGEDLGCIEHDGIDASQLLHNGDDNGNDKLRPVAGLQKSLQRVLDGISLSCLHHNVLELHLHILLAPDLLQYLSISRQL